LSVVGSKLSVGLLCGQPITDNRQRAKRQSQEEPMSEKPTDMEGIINDLASLRARLPKTARSRAAAPPPEKPGERMAFVPGDEEAMKAFEMLALEDTLESLLGDVQAIIQEKHEALIAKTLEIYYATEELSKDPEHADLIPHVEQMRAAYLRDFGTEIPPKK
jgi:hypothetical protein